MSSTDQSETHLPSEEELQAWFAGGEFTYKDYVSNKIGRWAEVLGPLREQKLEVLEIGALEGRSALFFLNYLPRSHLTCIDPFPKGLEAVFDRNLSGFSGRLEKMRAYSLPALIELRHRDRRFDLIYIDGDHRREAVTLDSVLSWPMLRRGGILIWDDYVYKVGGPLPERPAPAIDGFLVAHAGEYEELHRGKQIIVRKIVEAQLPRLRVKVDGVERRPSGWRKRLGRLWRAGKGR